MSAQLFYNPQNVLFTSRSLPAGAAEAYFFYTGTTSLAPIYSDAGLTTLLTNPAPADGLGRLPKIYMDSAIIYRVRAVDSNGVPMGLDTDPYIPGTTGDAAASAAAASALAAATSEANSAANAAASGDWAEQASLSAIAAGSYPNAAATNVPRGLTQASVGAITPGSAGTNGTFAVAWSGGNFVINPTASFTVAGGILTAFTVTGPGLYIGASPTVPTPSFSASSGLTGAAVALTAQFLISSGLPFWVVDATQSNLLLYQNVAGTSTIVSPAVSIPLSPSLAALIDSLSTYRYVVGRTTLSAGDVGMGAATFLLNNPLATATTLRRFRARGGSAGGTVRIVKGTLAGSAWTRTGFVDVTVTANADNSIAINFPVSLGEYVGISSSANALRYDTNLPVDGAGWQALGQNATTGTATLNTSGQLQFGFDDMVQTVTSTTLQPPVAGPLAGTSYDVIHQVDTLGVVQLQSLRHSDGLVTALTNGSVNALATQLDSGDRVYFGTRVGTAQISERTMLASGAAGSDIPFVSSADTAWWGDSLTQYPAVPASSPPAQFTTQTGRVAYNGGVSGETSTQIKTRMIAASAELRSRLTVFWVGRNNYSSQATVLADLATMIAALVPYRKRFVILSVMNGDTEGTGTGVYNAIIALNQAIAAAYPNNYFDIRADIIANGLSYNSLTPTANDLIDIAADISPRQLRQSGDFLHGNAYMYARVANRVNNFALTTRGW